MADVNKIQIWYDNFKEYRKPKLICNHVHIESRFVEWSKWFKHFLKEKIAIVHRSSSAP